jgi:trans-aconitate 2-methyltransferase
VAASWDPLRYGRYADERSRPFHELLARVRAASPSSVVDLGCGDGALTATLAGRWPGATVVGVDSSPEMLAAGDAARAAGVDLRQGDIATWRPDAPVGVLVSNAALQWVPEHPALLPGLVDALAPGGELAFQVPGNFGAPTHVLLAELRWSPRWRDRLGADADRGAAVLEPREYLDRLTALGCRVDAWETTYLHVLDGGPDAVLEWVRGTALRPVLARLPAGEAPEFEAEYAARLRQAYPAGAAGTVLPFRRIFVVARRPA